MTKVKQFFQDANIGYQFKERHKNPEWSLEKLIPLRSCLLHNNATPPEAVFMISKIPKWITTLEYPDRVDTGTGEIIYEDYETNDFRAAKGRKIRTVNAFCDFYEPLYRARKVSLLFHTFTRLEYAKKDMRRMVDKVKKQYQLIGKPIRGYLWAQELAINDKMESGYHVHYHLVVAIDRLRCTEIPEELKFNDLWGQRTGVEFIKRTVKGYLSKYLYKSDAKILGKRAYSISRRMR